MFLKFISSNGSITESITKNCFFISHPLLYRFILRLFKHPIRNSQYKYLSIARSGQNHNCSMHKCVSHFYADDEIVNVWILPYYIANIISINYGLKENVRLQNFDSYRKPKQNIRDTFFSTFECNLISEASQFVKKICTCLVWVLPAWILKNTLEFQLELAE